MTHVIEPMPTSALATTVYEQARLARVVSVPDRSQIHVVRVDSDFVSLGAADFEYQSVSR